MTRKPTPIPPALLDRLMAYLGTQPYVEVARLIDDISKAHNETQLPQLREKDADGVGT